MRVALGTTSKSKRNYVEEVVRELELEAVIEMVEVDSGVSDQPLSSRETKQGSVSRAKKALKKAVSADFSLGIEVGYQSDPKGSYEMMCWATIVDNNGIQMSAQSHKMRLPAFHQKILKENKYLGEYVKEYVEKATNGIEIQAGEIFRHRRPFIQTAVKSVLINYLVK